MAKCEKTGLQLSAELAALVQEQLFLNTGICYARLHIMIAKCQGEKKQISMERFLIYFANEGAYLLIVISFFIVYHYLFGVYV